MLVWWATEVECASAIARLERDGALDAGGGHGAFDRLKQLAGGWHEVDPSDAVREAAVRFLRVHPLRTADALQLAAAFVAAERRPSSLEIVTLDDRLAGGRAQGRIRAGRGVVRRVALPVFIVDGCVAAAGVHSIRVPKLASGIVVSALSSPHLSPVGPNPRRSVCRVLGEPLVPSPRS